MNIHFYTTDKEEREAKGIGPEERTVCDECPDRRVCEFAFDPMTVDGNCNGSCLAEK